MRTVARTRGRTARRRIIACEHLKGHLIVPARFIQHEVQNTCPVNEVEGDETIRRRRDRVAKLTTCEVAGRTSNVVESGEANSAKDMHDGSLARRWDAFNEG